jgi:hypothetical protein
VPSLARHAGRAQPAQFLATCQSALAANVRATIQLCLDLCLSLRACLSADVLVQLTTTISLCTAALLKL